MHGSKVTRTTRTIIVQEISETESSSPKKEPADFTQETFDSNSNVRPTEAKVFSAPTSPVEKATEGIFFNKNIKTSASYIDDVLSGKNSPVKIVEPLVSKNTFAMKEEPPLADKNILKDQVAISIIEPESMKKPKMNFVNNRVQPESIGVINTRRALNKKISSIKGPSGGMQTIGSRGHKALHHGNELQSIEDALLFKTFKPLFICMMTSGLFYVHKRKDRDSSFSTKVKQLFSLETYCFLVVCILFANFIRSLATFFYIDYEALNPGFPTEMLFKLTMCIFFYEAFARSFIAFTACRRSNKGWKDLFLNIDKVFYQDGIIPYENSLKKGVKIFIVISFFVSAVNVAISAYGMWGPADSLTTLYSIIMYPVTMDIPGALAFQIFFLLITFINSNVAMLILTFHTLACYVLYKEFEYLGRTVETKIRDDGQFTDDLEKFRAQHQKRCKLVEDADELFKYYIGNTYLTNLPISCLLFFSMTFDKSVPSLISSVIRCLYVVFQLIIISVIAIMINTQAHAPARAIHSIKVQKSGTRQLEINMFLSKLTNTEIGLTAWDMFVINKPSLLTIVGVIGTYYFLLVQIQVPPGGATSCNCYLPLPNGSWVPVVGHILQ